MSGQNDEGKDEAVEETLALCGGPFCFPCKLHPRMNSDSRCSDFRVGIIIYQGWMKIRNREWSPSIRVTVMSSTLTLSVVVFTGSKG